MDNSTQSPIDVAGHILSLRSELGMETTVMHVLKLVYLCHGWMLGNTGDRLINEPVEAWRYGPVIPSVYRRFKAFRGEPITIPETDLSGIFSEYQSKLIRKVLEAYKGYSAIHLSAITHRPGTPWSKVYRDGSGAGAIIPDPMIQEYYQRRIKVNS